MNLEEKVGQVMLIGVNGTAYSEEACQQIRRISPAGIAIESDNVRTPEQLSNFMHRLQSCAHGGDVLPLLTALAHEGQYVQRFQDKATTFPSAASLGAVGDPEAAFQMAQASGQELLLSGVNFVLGPVADVLLEPESAVIGSRSYGDDPAQVSAFVARAVEGYSTVGLLSAVKHFPGHGGVAEDSHDELPIDRASRAELDTLYLPPFVAGVRAGAPAVMLSHIVYPALDPGYTPATLSPTIIQYLRRELKFQGVVLTDAMTMKAVAASQPDMANAALRALQSGADLLLIPDAEKSDVIYKRLLKAVNQGELSETRLDEAVRRVLVLKSHANLMRYHKLELPEPDWAKHISLANRWAARAVSVMVNSKGQLPLPLSARKVLVAGPNPDWPFYSEMLATSLTASGREFELVTYPLPESGVLLDPDVRQTILDKAAEADLVIVFTWQSRLNRLRYNNDWQLSMVETMVLMRKPVVVVALKSPTDCQDFSVDVTCLATYGTVDGALTELINRLLGQ